RLKKWHILFLVVPKVTKQTDVQWFEISLRGHSSSDCNWYIIPLKEVPLDDPSICLEIQLGGERNEEENCLAIIGFPDGITSVAGILYFGINNRANAGSGG
ncbi:hypothetical protein ACFLWS_08365, partial [Chloroflexota bacterium]